MQPAITSLVESGLATAGASTLTLGESTHVVTLLDQLTGEFGPNPYSFFWILQEASTNPNLQAERQRNIWRDTLKDFEWFQSFFSTAELVMITDNGDLVFAIPGGTLCCNPRSDNYETYSMPPEQFLRSCRTLKSRVLPPDL